MGWNKGGFLKLALPKGLKSKRFIGGKTGLKTQEEGLAKLQGQSQRLERGRISGKPGKSVWSVLQSRSASQKFVDQNRVTRNPGVSSGWNIDMGKRISDYTRAGYKETEALNYYPGGKAEAQELVKVYRSSRSAKKGQPGYVDEVFGFGAADDPYKMGYSGNSRSGWEYKMADAKPTRVWDQNVLANITKRQG